MLIKSELYTKEQHDNIDKITFYEIVGNIFFRSDQGGLMSPPLIIVNN